MIFKKKMSDSSTKNGTENPYLSARRTWNHLMVGANSSMRAWQLIGIGGVLIGLSAISGLIYVGSQSKFIPFVIQVDKHGRSVAIAPADKTAALDPRVTEAYLATFINTARTVTIDGDLQRKNIMQLYSMLKNDDAAHVKMSNYLNGTPESNPFKRAENEMVSVDITSILAQTKDSWQVEWQETVYSRDGMKKMQYRMKAILTIQQIHPDSNTSEEKIRQNPIGLFIKDFSWTKEV